MVLTKSIKDVLDFQTFNDADTIERNYFTPETFYAGLAVYFSTNRWRHEFGFVGRAEGHPYETTVIPEVGSATNINLSNVYDAVKIKTAADILTQLRRLGTSNMIGPVTENVYNVIQHFHDVKNDQTLLYTLFRHGHDTDQEILDGLLQIELNTYKALNAKHETMQKLFLGTLCCDLYDRTALLVEKLLWITKVYRTNFSSTEQVHEVLVEAIFEKGNFGSYAHWYDLWNAYIEEFPIKKYKHKTPIQLSSVNLGTMSDYGNTHVQFIRDSSYGFLYQIDPSDENLLQKSVFIPESTIVHHAKAHQTAYFPRDEIVTVRNFGKPISVETNYAFTVAKLSDDRAYVTLKSRSEEPGPIVPAAYFVKYPVVHEDIVYSGVQYLCKNVLFEGDQYMLSGFTKKDEEYIQLLNNGIDVQIVHKKTVSQNDADRILVGDVCSIQALNEDTAFVLDKIVWKGFKWYAVLVGNDIPYVEWFPEFFLRLWQKHKDNEIAYQRFEIDLPKIDDVFPESVSEQNVNPVSFWDTIHQTVDTVQNALGIQNDWIGDGPRPIIEPKKKVYVRTQTDKHILYAGIAVTLIIIVGSL